MRYQYGLTPSNRTLTIRAMTKAFAYLRVSGKSQVHGDGFPRQLEAIKRYAKSNDIRIIEVFHEKAVGGATELENRPALMALMEALESNGTKLVLIEKLD
jgi:DNA invertase Pin-like site-specific DNA recombinase